MKQPTSLFWLVLFLAVPCALAAQQADQPPAKCSGFKALRNAKTSTYYLSATCEMPTPGHTVELVPAEPQGSDPTVYVLTEVVHAPDGMVAQVITPYKLRFRKRTRTIFKEFLINPGAIKVQVENIEPKAKTEGSTPAEATPDKK